MLGLIGTITDSLRRTLITQVLPATVKTQYLIKLKCVCIAKDIIAREVIGP